MRRCPRCKSCYIVEGICRMCGHLIYDSGSLTPRKCAACGRRAKFEGNICYACRETISLGATSVAENVRLYFRDNDLGQPGFCPAAAALAGKSRWDYRRLAVSNVAYVPNPSKERQKIRYHNDPAYREKCKAAAIEQQRKRREREKANVHSKEIRHAAPGGEAGSAPPGV